MVLFGDLETRSSYNLQKHGTHRYAEGAEILLFAYAIDDRPAQCWDAMHGEIHEPLLAALNDPECKLVFHNVPFDRTILRHTLINLPVTRFHCTQAQARCHGLPGGLDILGQILNIKQDSRKHKRGDQLIKLFCGHRASPDKYPEEWLEFIMYAMNDVEAMREVYKKLPSTNYRGKELELWYEDQRINDRGMLIDLELAQAAADLSEKSKADLGSRLAELTDGRVTKVTQGERIRREIPGLACLDMDTVKDALKRADLTADQRTILKLRQAGNKSSAAKFKRVIDGVSKDGRIRGVFDFSGAIRTRRWSSKLLQAHNLPRPLLKMTGEEIEDARNAIVGDIADLIYPDVNKLCSDMLRPLIIPPPGRTLVVGDWSGIEMRVLAWLAGESWKLKALRAFDAGEGDDVYKAGYSKALGVPVADVDGDMRQIGKGMELCSGYGGGVGAYVGVGTSYGLRLDELAVSVPRIVPDHVINAAHKAWGFAVRTGATFDLPKEQYVACDALKKVWRAANPATVLFWRNLEEATVSAVASPGDTYQVGVLSFCKHGNTLAITLPSGGKLLYPGIQVGGSDISFMKGATWRREKLYGGMLAENVSQAVSRDVMAYAMPFVAGSGFDIVLHVHDEIVAEVDEDSGVCHEDLCSIMAQPVSWAPGLPLAAEGFTTKRYRKG